ncbi:uncharacterized protein LOC127287511 isoform X2 [Leptopilina boulardi]|uniref:uncharacterized protein LOC127287511 isoform X2 n=1 Tax=Leptopilina boulardi TaxID=63433 RepID=UPI0021F55BD2|nr:uncharacterized protein LOC127287511 isoform X2 [Leptopilina boulardi]
MKYKFFMLNMVHAITILTILKMLTNAQTTCNNGLGRVVYERLPDHQLQDFDDDMVRDPSPPFRVFEKCQELCLRDRTAINNLVRACTSFDFQPGSRIASFSGTPEYEDSSCYLTREQAQPDGIGNLMLVPNSVHFTEVCLTSNRIERDCPNRRYIFERHPRKKLKLQLTEIKEVPAANRTECEDRCLNEFSFICRSATYNAVVRSCSLSRFTRRSYPDFLEDDPNSDYLENTCLTADRRCDGLMIFVKEVKMRLKGPFELDVYANLTLDECQALCSRAEKYFCRSVEYDEQTHQCAIFEEDSVSQRDDIGGNNSPNQHFYELVCLDNPRGSEYPDKGVTTTSFSDEHRPDTAFERYRNARLSGEFHSEITGRSLSECLEECLRQISFQCKSAVYSEHFHTCRLSRFNQRDRHRTIFDADYDYYENLMHQYLDGDSDVSSHRPDPLGQDTNYERHSFGRPGFVDDYYKPSLGIEKDIRFQERYPELNPQSLGRYPVAEAHRYPGEFKIYPSKDHYLSDDKYNRIYKNRYPPNFDHYSRERYPTDKNFLNENKIPVRGPYYSDNFENYPVYEPHSINRFPIYRRRFLNILPHSQVQLLQDHFSNQENLRYSSGHPKNNRRYPIEDFPSKDMFFKRVRYPGVNGKEHYDRPPYYESLSFNSIRPLSNEVYGEGGTVGGGYIGEGGIYQSKPFVINGPISDRPPLLARCDEQTNFRRVAHRMRVRKPFIRGSTSALSIQNCDRECADTRHFVCRSFNFKPLSNEQGGDQNNCELSDRDSRDMEMNNPLYYDSGTDFDFYERNNGRQGGEAECLDVTQTCSEDGMEFTLRTPEGFTGRIYTYGYYDRCFFRGSGGTINVLRISGTQGYPDCGTQRYGDAMTNIVVVQFSDYVQTAKDKRFNLTCLFRGPDETVVTSDYIGAGRSGAPIPIEYLPAENTLNNRVRLLILYQGRPTTTIAVGDPLTFRLEAQDGSVYPADIFATNVVARDPYSGRSVQLIDRYGCPVDNFVFPGLDRLRDGDSLEARFNAFKIPESNFLVFEATVRTCSNGCQPAYCSSSSGAGRNEPSFGRKRRDLDSKNTINKNITEENFAMLTIAENDINNQNISFESIEEGDEEYVREMIEVFASRNDLDGEKENILIDQQINALEKICLSSNEYFAFITAVITLVAVLFAALILHILICRRYSHLKALQHRKINKSSAHRQIHDDFCNKGSINYSFLRSSFQKAARPVAISSIMSQRRTSEENQSSQRSNIDPSEPIYTDPSLFEFGRSALIKSQDIPY